MEGKDFVEAYLNWLREKITLSMVNEHLEMTTPFLDSHNDHIQLYLKQDGGRIIMTDDGYTISDLLTSGCDISSEKRQQVLGTILNGFGVKLSGGELIVEANEHTFPQKKHALLQAIMSVSDMFMMAQTRVASIFLEDIEVYFEKNEVRFTPSVQFIGKSGLPQSFDFVIPASKAKPERLIRAINNPSRDKVQSALFAWNDTRDTRKNDSKMCVFLNDSERDIQKNILSAFEQYSVYPIIWSKRNDAIAELAA